MNAFQPTARVADICGGDSVEHLVAHAASRGWAWTIGTARYDRDGECEGIGSLQVILHIPDGAVDRDGTWEGSDDYWSSGPDLRSALSAALLDAYAAEARRRELGRRAPSASSKER